RARGPVVAEVRLLSVRRRPAALYRESVCHDGDGARAGNAGSAFSFRPATRRPGDTSADLHAPSRPGDAGPDPPAAREPAGGGDWPREAVRIHPCEPGMPITNGASRRAGARRFQRTPKLGSFGGQGSPDEPTVDSLVAPVCRVGDARGPLRGF